MVRRPPTGRGGTRSGPGRGTEVPGERSAVRGREGVERGPGVGWTERVVGENRIGESVRGRRSVDRDDRDRDDRVHGRTRGLEPAIQDTE